MAKTLTIAGVTCNSGQKVYREVEVDSSNSLGTVLPIMLVNGVRDGPLLCITAGMYGDEYPGVEAAIRTFNNVDPKKLRGGLVILPVMNMPSFQWRVFGPSPVDHKDLNRVYPGNPNGTVTERLADLTLNKIIMVSDFHVDLRGGDTHESHMTHMIMCRSGNLKLDRVAFEGARSFGLEYIMIHDGGKEGATPGILLQEASKLGKPTIVSEIGIGLTTFREEDIKLTEEGIVRLMKHLGMTEGQRKPQPRKVKIMRNQGRVTCKQGGIFYPTVEQSGPWFTCLLEKGQKVGEIRNIRGELVEELRAPVSGVLHELLPKRVVFSGETLVLIRTVEESAAYFED